MKIGYLRQSGTIDDDEDELKRVRLTSRGCEIIYEDGSTPAKYKNRFLKSPQRARDKLSLALDLLEPGDKFIVFQLNHLGLSIRGVVHLVNLLSAAGIYFASVAEKIDTSRAKIGNSLPELSKSLAKLDCDLSRDRSAKSREIAKIKNLVGGRPKTISLETLKKASELINSGTSVRDAAKMVEGVSQATLYRRLGAKKI